MVERVNAKTVIPSDLSNLGGVKMTLTVCVVLPWGCVCNLYAKVG